MNQELIDLIIGRKSIRKFDPNQKISRNELQQMIGEASRAPSALNLQPWRFLVIESAAGKEKLKPLFFNSPTIIDDSAAMIAVMGDLQASDYKDSIYDRAVAEGKMPEEERIREIQMITTMYANMPHDNRLTDVSFNSALAAMQLMLIARAHGYETCPLGGFKKDQFGEVFGFSEDRYIPFILLAIGKPMEKGFDTIRLQPDEIIKWA
ncbi:MAG: nitroreductase family protein [Sporolactobacillus sp.]